MNEKLTRILICSIFIFIGIFALYGATFGSTVLGSFIMFQEVIYKSETINTNDEFILIQNGMNIDSFKSSICFFRDSNYYDLILNFTGFQQYTVTSDNGNIYCNYYDEYRANETIYNAICINHNKIGCRNIQNVWFEFVDNITNYEKIFVNTTIMSLSYQTYDDIFPSLLIYITTWLVFIAFMGIVANAIKCSIKKNNINKNNINEENKDDIELLKV